MPQMSPLLWLNLYAAFSVIFLLIMISSFFIKPPMKIKPTKEPLTPPDMNWKW